MMTKKDFKKKFFWASTDHFKMATAKKRDIVEHINANKIGNNCPNVLKFCMLIQSLIENGIAQKDF